MADDEPDEFDVHARKCLRRIVDAKVDRLARRAIRRIRQLREGYCQSGPDSGLTSVWEEWKHQIQREQSFFFPAYEEAIRDICRAVCAKLSAEDRDLVWLQSDEFIDWYFEHGKADSPPEMIDGCAVDAVYSRVTSIASDEDLEADL